MKMKKSITFLLAIIAIFMNVSVFAKDIILISPRPTKTTGAALEYISKSDNDVIKLQMDGEYVDFTDASGDVVNPVLINSRTMIPVAKIFSMLECPYVWDGAERKVIATTDKKEITLTIDSEILKVKDLETNEEEEIILDSVPVIRNNRTLVPARVITECLGKTVGWDDENRTVIIIDFNKITEDFKDKVPNLQKVFDLEIEPVKSFKSTSEIKGNLIYKDSENKKNNQSLEIEGSLILNQNEKEEMEMYIDLEYSGKGIIYEAMKEAEKDKVYVEIVKADDSIFVASENEAGVGSELGNYLMLENLLNGFETKNSYADYVEEWKKTLGELNAESYNELQQKIDEMAKMYSEDNFAISGTNKNKKIKFNITGEELLNTILGSYVKNGKNIDISVTQTISNGNIKSIDMSFGMIIELPASKECFEINYELDMKYKNINKDFEIVLPESSL